MTDNPVLDSMPIVSDEQKAYDFVMMHYRRVVTLDEVNNKAINRAGKTGDAVRELLGALYVYSRIKDGAKVMRIEE